MRESRFVIQICRNVTSTAHRNLVIQKLNTFFRIITGKLKTAVDRINLKQKVYKFVFTMCPDKKNAIKIKNHINGLLHEPVNKLRSSIDIIMSAYAGAILVPIAVPEI